MERSKPRGGRSSSEDVKSTVSSKAAGPVPLSAEQRSLVADNLGLVRLHLRKRVRTSRRPRREREYEDLYQEGCIALARAASRFRPDRDGDFPAFALPRIRGAIYAAIHHKFSLVHVPMSAGARAEPGPRIVPLAADVSAAAPASGESVERLAHAIRRRFERAVRQSLTDFRARRWRQRNPCAIIERLAAERLLVSDISSRTPLRHIARDAGVSSGRAAEYERLLQQEVARRLQADPQLPLLTRFAREDDCGSDGALDAVRRDALMTAELDAFEQRFRAMSKPDRAAALYALIERSSPQLDEVARNLFRLAGGDTE